MNKQIFSGISASWRRFLVCNPRNPAKTMLDRCLSVGLGHTLQFILLLDSVAVGGTLGSIDELVRETLSDGLDVPESGLPGTGAEQPDGLVDPPERRHINSLTPDGSSSSDTG